MRLTAVVLHSSYDLEDIEFSLRENASNRYVVRSIVGIDAEELIPKFYGFGTNTGQPFYDRVMRPRNVVMRVGLNPKFRVNETVSEIRDEIYRLVSANRSGQIQIQFVSGGATVAVINGRITKLEVPYFTQRPEVQITITCPDPTFRSIFPLSIPPAELPSANPVFIADTASTAHHGFALKVKFTGTAPEFTIQDHPTTPEWHFTVEPPGGFVLNDELHISSEYGNKLVFHDPATGPSVHLMDMVSSDSIWPTLFPGSNTFHFNQIAVIDWLELTYYSAYWGV